MQSPVIMSPALTQSTTNEVKYQVLLIEHDPVRAELILRSFKSHVHYQLITVHTLREAKTSLAKISPNLIITDFHLPDGNGGDLITDNNKIADCPIILITRFDDETVAVDVMKACASDHIVKMEISLFELPLIANSVLREWRLILDKKIVLEQQNRLTDILEETPDLICIADIDGYLTYINNPGRQMLGLSDDENIKQIRLADFHTSEDARMINSEGIPYAIEHGVWTQETTFIAKSKEQILTSQVLIAHKSELGIMEFFSTIARDIRYVCSAEEKVQYLAYYDALTDLPNRNELLKQLDFEIARVHRKKSQSALLFIDLDNFKSVNDTLGHPVGDLVLKEVSLRLKSSIRADDILARLGGDEFVVILTSLSDDSLEALNQARDVSKKLNSHIALDMLIGKSVFNLTSSIGISMFSSETNNSHELLQFADTAMYEAKKSGKNQFEVFHQNMGEDVSSLLKLEHRLRRAYSNKEFVLFYQPKINSQTGKMQGAEVLLRWNDPKNGITEPNFFLDILESSTLISDVGDWVLEASFSQLALWIAEGLWDTQYRLSINVSAREFQNKNFAKTVLYLLEKINVPAQCINLEITEHSVMNDVKKAVVMMDSLIAKGITFSLDDFGTGYSSLGYLKSLPIETLKIDQSFIRNITNDDSDEALVTSIIAISKNLGLAVMAEGVETEHQMQMLKDFQCDFMQGYYFSHPIPVETFSKLLTNEDI